MRLTSDAVAKARLARRKSASTAEIHLVSRDRAAASTLLSESPRSGEAFGWITAKHRFLEGQLALLQGRLPDARKILEDAGQLADRVSAADVRLDVGNLKGQVAILERQWPEAEATLNDTVRRAQEKMDRYREAVALLNLGTSHLFRDRFGHALQYFERVLAFEHTSGQLVYAVALSNAGICHYRLGEVDRAIEVQKQAGASHERPGRPRVYHERALGELGTTYLVKGDVSNGVACLQRAIDVGKQAGLAAGAARWASNLSVALIRQRDWEGAEQANNASRALGGDLADLAGYQVSDSAA